jgi:hypothetical protein
MAIREEVWLVTSANSRTARSVSALPQENCDAGDAVEARLAA